MNDTEILNRLIPILEDTFAETDCNITLQTIRDDIEEWDSLAQVRLFLALETDFEFKFDLEEMDDIDGVEDLVRIISSKIN